MERIRFDGEVRDILDDAHEQSGGATFQAALCQRRRQPFWLPFARKQVNLDPKILQTSVVRESKQESTHAREIGCPPIRKPFRLWGYQGVREELVHPLLRQEVCEAVELNVEVMHHAAQGRPSRNGDETTLLTGGPGCGTSGSIDLGSQRPQRRRRCVVASAYLIAVAMGHSRSMAP